MSLPEIETGSLVNGVKYIKDIKMPEDFEITFLEDELGLTIRLIEFWREKIVGYDNYVMYSDTATSKTNVNGQDRKIAKSNQPNNTNKSENDNYRNSLSSNTKKKSDLIQNFSGSTITFFNDDPRGLNSIGAGNQKVKGIEAYKANMTLKPLSLQDDLGIPPFPSFQMKGAFPKSIDSITFSHDSEEIMMHKVKFSVDTIYTLAI